MFSILICLLISGLFMADINEILNDALSLWYTLESIFTVMMHLFTPLEGDLIVHEAKGHL